jgi:TM2 domain-containing membrane protein YozV
MQVHGFHGPAAPVRDSTKLIVALLLWFFVGTLGVHRMYLGHTGSGVAMLLLSLVGWTTVWFCIGFVPLIAVSIWWLIDVFLLVTGALAPTDGTRLV